MTVLITAAGAVLPPAGACVNIDNTMQNWFVNIHNDEGCGPDDLKGLLQRKYEVVGDVKREPENISGWTPFTFTTRSLNYIGKDDLRDLITTRYAVLDVADTADLAVVARL